MEGNLYLKQEKTVLVIGIYLTQNVKSPKCRKKSLPIDWFFAIQFQDLGMSLNLFQDCTNQIKVSNLKNKKAHFMHLLLYGCLMTSLQEFFKV